MCVGRGLAFYLHMLNSWMKGSVLFLGMLRLGAALLTPFDINFWHLIQGSTVRLGSAVGVMAMVLRRMVQQMQHSVGYRSTGLVYGGIDVWFSQGLGSLGRQCPRRKGKGTTSRASARQGGRGDRQATTASSVVQSALGGTRHFNNIGGRTPIGQPDRERLEVYTTEVLVNMKEFTRIYVDGIPKRVTLTGHHGIPDVIQNVEQILD